MKQKNIPKELIEMLMVADGIKEEDFDKEYRVLYLVEGHSASSIVRTCRNAKAHGVLALRGKIMNCYGKTFSGAMRSEIVKEFLETVQKENYDKIVILTDADPDGSHITSLILTCASKFLKTYVKSGKFFICDTPLYTYQNKFDLIGWGNSPEIPEEILKKFPRANAMACKGLGSYSTNGFERMALYPQKGAQYIQIEYDKEADNSLYQTMKRGFVDMVHFDSGIDKDNLITELEDDTVMEE